MDNASEASRSVKALLLRILPRMKVSDLCLETLYLPLQRSVATQGRYSARQGSEAITISVTSALLISESMEGLRMSKEIENEAWKSENLWSFAESPKPLGPRFSHLALPGSKLPVNWNALARFNIAESILGASPPITDGPGVARAARIVTSTKLSNCPIGPTIHSQDCESAGKTRLWNRA
jgi:hypothetical protein